MAELSRPVRDLVVELGAETLEGLRAEEVPAALRAVTRFTASRRVRLGATAIATAIEADEAFRRRVLGTLARRTPGLVDAVSEGVAPPAADPVVVATAAYLARADGWQDLVAASAAAEAGPGEQTHDAARTRAALDRLQQQYDQARAEVRDVRSRSREEVGRLKSDNTRLRRVVAELRATVASLEAVDVDTVTQERDTLRTEAESTRGELRRLRARVAELESERGSTRRQERSERAQADSRLALLVDTVVGAATGLRRELALPVGEELPADSVAADRADPGELRRPRGGHDPAAIVELLALPRAHLVVDGYNVTKTAWPRSPLEATRTRLAQALGSLAARTGAEITCVFDGAAVGGNSGVPGVRAVRVLFSRPGESADDLIRALVAAEPVGRPIVVVTSDQEIVADVRGPGVHPVSAASLVDVLVA